MTTQGYDPIIEHDGHNNYWRPHHLAAPHNTASRGWFYTVLMGPRAGGGGPPCRNSCRCRCYSCHQVALKHHTESNPRSAGPDPHTDRSSPPIPGFRGLDRRDSAAEGGKYPRPLAPWERDRMRRLFQYSQSLLSSLYAFPLPCPTFLL